MMTNTTTDSIDFELDELLALAQLDLEKGNIENALRKLKRLVAAKNPPIEAYTMAARTYAQLGLFERAKALFKSYLKHNPDAIVESFQLGMTHFDAGEKEEAMTIWDAIIKKEPVHPPALFYRGLVLAQQGKTADAKQSLDTLMQSAPADNLYFNRAKELLQALNNGQAISAGNNGGQSAVSTVRPDDAYKVEH